MESLVLRRYDSRVFPEQSQVLLYLQEALGVLQQVNPTVTAVVLLRHAAVGAPHGVGREQTGRPPPDRPLHLQVAEDNHRNHRYEQLQVELRAALSHEMNTFTKYDTKYWGQFCLSIIKSTMNYERTSNMMFATVDMSEQPNSSATTSCFIRVSRSNWRLWCGSSDQN